MAGHPLRDTAHGGGEEPWTPPELTSTQRRELARQWLRSVDVEATSARIAKLAPLVLLHHPASDRGRIASQLVRAGVLPTAAAVEEVYARQTLTRAVADESPAAAEPRPQTTVLPPQFSAAPGSSETGPTTGAGDKEAPASPAPAEAPAPADTACVPTPPVPAPSGLPTQGRTPAQRAKRARYRARVRERRLEQERAEIGEVLDEAAAAKARAFVIATRDQTGEGPLWSELSRHMGWKVHLGGKLYIPALIDAGVLTHTPARRSLDVGSGGTDQR